MQWKMQGGGWNPYLAGALAGLLAVLSAWATTAFLGRTNTLGASTTFVRAAGYAVQSIAPGRMADNPYFSRIVPRIDWQFMLVVGIVIGAFMGSLTGRGFKIEGAPPIWRTRFGPSLWKRMVGAVLGGVLAMVGARLADGCPSGHGLSGLMQLSVSGFVALVCFFGSGVLAAKLVYGGKRHDA